MEPNKAEVKVIKKGKRSSNRKCIIGFESEPEFGVSYSYNGTTMEKIFHCVSITMSNGVHDVRIELSREQYERMVNHYNYVEGKK